MAKMRKELSSESRQLIVNLRREDYRWVQIARLLKLNESTVRRVFLKFLTIRYVKTGGKPGRVKHLSETQILRLLRKKTGKMFERHYY